MIEEYRIKDMNDVHELVKMLTAETIQAALDAELENDLGYSKYDYNNKQTDKLTRDCVRAADAATKAISIQ